MNPDLKKLKRILRNKVLPSAVLALLPVMAFILYFTYQTSDYAAALEKEMAMEEREGVVEVEGEREDNDGDNERYINPAAVPKDPFSPDPLPPVAVSEEPEPDEDFNDVPDEEDKPDIQPDIQIEDMEELPVTK